MRRFLAVFSRAFGCETCSLVLKYNNMWDDYAYGLQLQTIVVICIFCFIISKIDLCFIDEPVGSIVGRIQNVLKNITNRIESIEIRAQKTQQFAIERRSKGIYSFFFKVCILFFVVQILQISIKTSTITCISTGVLVDGVSKVYWCGAPKTC